MANPQHLEITFMYPSSILFSRLCIPETFSDSNIFIHHVLARLTVNPKIANTLPCITVRPDTEGHWRTEDNRYLYAFRVLEMRGIVDKIQVKIDKKVMEEIEYVENIDGCHVKMPNNAISFPHCACSAIFQKRQRRISEMEAIEQSQF